jgi:hypothetical protein
VAAELAPLVSLGTVKVEERISTKISIRGRKVSTMSPQPGRGGNGSVWDQ